MSAPMKARRIKQEIPIRIGPTGKEKPRLFLVPKTRASDVIKSLREFEVETDGESVPWNVPVQDLIDAYTEPGAALRGARARDGLSQSQLATKLGIPVPNISEMENGKRPIGKKMAHRFAKIFKVHYKVFL